MQSFQPLRYDNDFNPCPAAEKDEIFAIGIFEFNISWLLQKILLNPSDFPVTEVLVEDFPREFSHINEGHMDSVQLIEPVMLAEVSPERFTLIDGNHRMEKARRLERTTIEAFKIPVEHLVPSIISRNAYETFINYWNGKIQENNHSSARRLK